MSPRELLVARGAILAMVLHVVLGLTTSVPGWAMFADVEQPARIVIHDRDGRNVDARAVLPRDAMVMDAGPALLRVAAWLGRVRPEGAPYTGLVHWRGQDFEFRVAPGGELETWRSSRDGPTGSPSPTSDVSPPSSRGS